MKRFGEKLKMLRERAGMTQQDLANQLGFSRYHVSGLEIGRKHPHVQLTVKIADIFGVTVDQLVRDELDV
ncbi:MAG: helix-turn-helix transcriptional regulator [Chloroflexaceae bacterium]|nr:helix-turn-helix transcriptional regulator [Chloroflexaceae bacterium]